MYGTTAEFEVTEKRIQFRWIKRIVTHTHCTAADGIVTKNCRRSKKDNALDTVGSKITGSHGSYDSTLRMACQGNIANKRQ